MLPARACSSSIHYAPASAWLIPTLTTTITASTTIVSRAHRPLVPVLTVHCCSTTFALLCYPLYDPLACLSIALSLSLHTISSPHRACLRAFLDPRTLAVPSPSDAARHTCSCSLLDRHVLSRLPRPVALILSYPVPCSPPSLSVQCRALHPSIPHHTTPHFTHIPST